jgi:hypothetical protein
MNGTTSINSGFYHAVIYVLTQEGHYVSRVTYLGLTVNSRNTNLTYSGPFNGNGKVDTDDTVWHLAKTGQTIEWAAYKDVMEFAQAYIREWIRHHTPSSRDDIRLRCIYASIYSQPPNVNSSIPWCWSANNLRLFLAMQPNLLLWPHILALPGLLHSPVRVSYLALISI